MLSDIVQSLPYITGFTESQQSVFLKFINAVSLTQFLTATQQKFSVNPFFLGNKVLQITDCVGIEQAQQYFVREVQLRLNNVPVVIARSSCDPTSEYWMEFLNCGKSSLGERLYHVANLSRTKFMFFKITNDHPLTDKMFFKETIARQSVFEFADDKLILTECFLPSIKKFF